MTNRRKRRRDEGDVGERETKRPESVDPASFVRDLSTFGKHGANLGFGIAKTATSFGFGISKTVFSILGAAENVAFQNNGVLSQSVTATLNLAEDITHACMTTAKTATEAILTTGDDILEECGVKNGALFKSLGFAHDTSSAMMASFKIVTHHIGDAMTLGPVTVYTQMAKLSSLQKAHNRINVTRQNASYFPPEMMEAMGHSAAVYGPTMLEFFEHDAVPRTVPDCIQLLTKSDDVDVIDWNEISETFRPAYALSWDRESRTIFLAFRGSMSGADALTDLSADTESVSFHNTDGSMHRGFFQAGEKLNELLLGQIVSLMEAHNTRDLIVTGHSLGAAAAAVVFLNWNQQFPRWNIRAYLFSPPPVCTENICAHPEVQSRVTSLIVGNDIVPRFSRRTTAKLSEMIRYMADHPHIESEMAAGRYYAKMREDLAAHEHIVKHARLFPMGRILYLPSLESMLPVVISPTVMDEIIIDATMLDDHLPKYMLQLAKRQNAAHHASVEIDVLD